MEEYNSTNNQIVSNKYTIFIMSLIFVLPALYFGLEKCNFDQSEINEYNLRNPNSLELNTIQEVLPTIRLLQIQNTSDHTTHDKQKTKQSSNIAQNSFLLIIVIISIVVVVVGIICCAACIIRCVMKIQGRRGTISSKIANQNKLKIGQIYPQVQYGIFIQYVGHPLQDNCVICLDDFQHNKQQINKSCKQCYIFQSPKHYSRIKRQRSKTTINNVLNITSQNDRKSQPIQYIQQIKLQPIYVKLTICGHLFHSKCLDSWLLKQQNNPNCPLCRQQFTEQNIKKWESKIGVQLLISKQAFIKKYGSINRKQTQNITKKTQIQQTLNSVSPKRQKTGDILYMAQLTQLQKEQLTLYIKIMSFHKKTQCNFRKLSSMNTSVNYLNDQMLYIEPCEQKNDYQIGIRKMSLDDEQNIKEQSKIDFEPKRRRAKTRYMNSNVMTLQQ